MPDQLTTRLRHGSVPAYPIENLDQLIDLIGREQLLGSLWGDVGEWRLIEAVCSDDPILAEVADNQIDEVDLIGVIGLFTEELPERLFRGRAVETN